MVSQERVFKKVLRRGGKDGIFKRWDLPDFSPPT